jgi:hypothetical protein
MQSDITRHYEYLDTLVARVRALWPKRQSLDVRENILLTIWDLRYTCDHIDDLHAKALRNKKEKKHFSLKNIDVLAD